MTVFLCQNSSRNFSALFFSLIRMIFYLDNSKSHSCDLENRWLVTGETQEVVVCLTLILARPLTTLKKILAEQTQLMQTMHVAAHAESTSSRSATYSSMVNLWRDTGQLSLMQSTH